MKGFSKSCILQLLLDNLLLLGGGVSERTRLGESLSSSLDVIEKSLLDIFFSQRRLNKSFFHTVTFYLSENFEKNLIH